jgi:hypothetical protein
MVTVDGNFTVMGPTLILRYTRAAPSHPVVYHTRHFPAPALHLLAPLRSTHRTFSHRCVPHTEPFYTPTHHVTPSRTAPLRSTCGTLSVLTPLCTTHGTFLHPHAPHPHITHHAAHPLTPHHPPGCTCHAPHAIHPQISDHIPPATIGHSMTHTPSPLFARSLHCSIVT